MTIAGIVGGTGPESTIDYYRRIIRRYGDRRGDGSAALLPWQSLRFFDRDIDAKTPPPERWAASRAGGVQHRHAGGHTGAAFVEPPIGDAAESLRSESQPLEHHTSRSKEGLANVWRFHPRGVISEARHGLCWSVHVPSTRSVESVLIAEAVPASEPLW